MTILYFSEEKIIRDQIKSFLLKLSKKKKDLKILDIGADANPWLGKLITDTLDIFKIKRFNINSHVGDANLLSSYERFKENEFDFVNCTHTLEDIRCPDIAISQIIRIGKAGFIATPNRHTEVSNLRKFEPFGNKYLLGGSHIGFFHHRWIFNNTENNTIEAYAKWSGICSTESIYEKIVKRIANLPLLRKKYLNIITKLGVKSFGKYSWIQPKLVNFKHAELSFLWQDEFNFNYFNNDFAGSGDPESLRLFNEFVSKNPTDIDKSIQFAFESIEERILSEQ